ncbi:MAG: SAM-dependent methyltransferase [Chitinophagaceae bacterium]|nr:SAM-dependent methyltransferase [Chitinophagaceae bacterium]
MKDLFSSHAEEYQKYRPSYPEELYLFLFTLVSKKETAWDCGTGNGQVAVVLAHYFEHVYATDLSEKQLQQAPSVSNIHYKIEPAEQTSFPDHLFDLITVAQAIHWFDFNLFYKEVRRTLKPEGIVAVMGYGLLRTEDSINLIIDHFYTQIIGPYWDTERRYIDEQYQTIPFPFEEIKAPAFNHTVEWNLHQLIGYLNTWSAVRFYEKKEQLNPLSLIEEQLGKAWGAANKTKSITFPILLRIGKANYSI